jgi:phosphoribosylaminoimidazolecarboxamide formyltransferase/IMP cyclohydrolase
VSPLALLSLTGKTGAAGFGAGLVALGFELVSTGGTAKLLRDAGLRVLDVSDLTGFPEMLDGRVKTLHPMIHGGILGDPRVPSHRAQMEAAGLRSIQVVAVNLYPFERTVTARHTPEEAIEAIDIGGPALIRAAAKNHANVLVVVDPEDYGRALDALASGNTVALGRELAAKALRHTAYYDSMIARYLTGEAAALDHETFTAGLRRVARLRYGENPHQRAAVYADPFGGSGIAQASQLWGKELGYNNYLDADAAWELAADLPPGSCAIVKHGNPCGAAATGDLAASYLAARAADTESAFGGIAAFNGPVGEAAALAMTAKGNFLEVVIATAFDEAALRVFRGRSGWGQDVRLLAAPLPVGTAGLRMRSIRGGMLVQDSREEPEAQWRVVTVRQPSDAEWEALRLAWRIVRHVKSNAIVVCDPDRMLGVGAGQTSRVRSVRLAIEQAGAAAKGAALASDAFFPFPDGVEIAAAAGVSAIVQPGGGKKDAEVIAAADRQGVAMACTGVRQFRH